MHPCNGIFGNSRLSQAEVIGGVALQRRVFAALRASCSRQALRRAEFQGLQRVWGCRQLERTLAAWKEVVAACR